MKINRDKVREEFKAYVQSYDMTDIKIRLKQEHTYQVATLSEVIAKSLDLEPEWVDLAWLIGMLHDLGRFEQLRRFGTFIDSESIDHAQFAAELLFEERLIRRFIKATDYDQIICAAIQYHNAYRVLGDLDEQTMLFCDIIRDADKVDIFRVNVQVPLSEIYNIPMEAFYESEITCEVSEAFFSGDTVLKSLKKTPIDHLIGQISLYNGLVFPKSRELVRGQGYMEQMFAFPTKNAKVKRELKRMKAKIGLRTVILASASPRRTKLLSQVGILHEIIPSDCKEIVSKTAPEEVVIELSRQKAEDVFEKYVSDPNEDVIMIGADTVVAMGGTILGKPQDEKDAFRMLMLLQGNTHQVYTGVTLLRFHNGEEEIHTFYECSQVHLYPISEQEIQAYIATKEPMDKAGAYGIQGKFAMYVKGIEGDYNNIVGLPVARICQELKNLEWTGNNENKSI